MWRSLWVGQGHVKRAHVCPCVVCCCATGAYKIKGVGDVLAGRVEQGIVKPGDEVIFLPTHTAANPCTGKVFTVEMHHKRVEKAGPGDNVGMNIKGLDKGNMPRTGDVMILKSDGTLKPAADFTAQIQTLDIPGEVKAGYSPIGFVRCGRAACRMKGINWKVRMVMTRMASNQSQLSISLPCSPCVLTCIACGENVGYSLCLVRCLTCTGRQGDRWQEAGGPHVPEGQRDG